MVGDDLVTGAVPAVAAAAWTLALARRASVGALVAAGTALGIATCTRPHLALVVMVVAAAVGALAGWRRAVLVGATASAVWALLIVPFLLGGSARFSPWHVAAKVTGDRGAHDRDRRRRAGGGGAAARRARAWSVRRRRAPWAGSAPPMLFAPSVLSAGPAARGRTGRGARPDAGGRGGALRPVGGVRPPPGHGRRAGPADGPAPRRGVVTPRVMSLGVMSLGVVGHGTRRIALALGAGVAAASLVVLTLGLPTGRTFGVEDNGDGFRLFCGLGMVPRTVDRIAAWKGGVVTDFAVVASPTCGMSTPSSAALVLAGRDARRRRLGGALDRGLVVRGARRAGGGARRPGRPRRRVPDAPAVLVVPVAPLALPAFTRFFVSTYGEPAGPARRPRGGRAGSPRCWSRAPGSGRPAPSRSTLTALGGAVAATAKVGYLPVLVAAVVACAVVTVGRRRRLGPAIALVTASSRSPCRSRAAVQFQDQVYGGANVHDVVFTLALPELGPDGPAALGLPPEAADVAGDGFFNGPPLPTAGWWVRAIGEDADATRAAAHGALVRHPGALLRGLGVGLQATTRADLPVPRRGPRRPRAAHRPRRRHRLVRVARARPPRRSSTTPRGRRGSRRRWCCSPSPRPAPRSLWRHREPAAARWCLAAGLAAVTALGLVAAAVLGDGYFEVFKHVWLAAYLLVLSGLGLLGAGGAVGVPRAAACGTSVGPDASP